MIHVQDLCKSFQQTPILTDLTFHLDAGDRLALLGANGSGKTLLLKIIATLIKPTSGSIEVAGYDAISDPRAVRPLIGYVPETFDGYAELSIEEYLEFFAGAYQLERTQRSSTITDVLDLMDLGALRERKIGRLSLGQKRRLCLAKTFMHEPLVWLLDSPTSVLDPQGQTEMGALIQELGEMGKTVILATNRLADATAACNRVGILKGGSFAVYVGLADIPQQRGNQHQLEIEIMAGTDAAQKLLEGKSDLISFEVTDSHIQIESQMADAEIANLLRDLIHAGVSVLRFQKSENWLEDLFLTVARGED